FQDTLHLTQNMQWSLAVLHALLDPQKFSSYSPPFLSRSTVLPYIPRNWKTNNRPAIDNPVSDIKHHRFQKHKPIYQKRLSRYSSSSTLNTISVHHLSRTTSRPLKNGHDIVDSLSTYLFPLPIHVFLLTDSLA